MSFVVKKWTNRPWTSVYKTGQWDVTNVWDGIIIKQATHHRNTKKVGGALLQIIIRSYVDPVPQASIFSKGKSWQNTTRGRWIDVSIAYPTNNDCHMTLYFRFSTTLLVNSFIALDLAD